MKRQILYDSKWGMSMALIIILAIVGCAGQEQASTVPTEASSTAAASSPPPVSIESTATSQPVPAKNVLYQDNFTNESTGWPKAEFDNYFIGYHEPEYYHVEITSPNSRAPIIGIPEPEQHSYGDVTIELQVLIASGRTSPEGDFRYGLAFRRSGDQYYAFTISPRAKKWYVFKSSPNGLVPLKEGTDDSIHDGDVDDLLRVDAQGPNFLFHINDRLVGQVADPDYTGGEVGFYVESIDSPNIHIHFDTLTVRNLEVSVLCNFNAKSLYVRSGPGKRYTPIAVLSTGDTFEPFGLSADREWIKIKVKGSEDPGWVFISESFMSCNAPIDFLPIVSP